MIKRITLTIARAELRSLFCSPAAWLALFLFTVQCTGNLLTMLVFAAKNQALGEQVPGLSQWIYLGPFGCLAATANLLYLYIPLLTMGAFAAEVNGGTICLLYASPVRIRDIVTGKLIGYIVFSCVLLVPVLADIVIGELTISSLDVLPLFGSILGLLLLCCSYAAIGIWLSSLTRYPIIAGLLTLSILALFQYLRQIRNAPVIIQRLGALLGFGGRAQTLISGLLNSRDILFFLAVIVLFTCLTIVRLQWRRLPVTFWRKAAQVTALVSLFSMLSFFSARPGMIWYKDLTINQANTISQESRDVLAAVKGPLTVTYYVNILDGMTWAGWGSPDTHCLDKIYWEPFRRFKPDLSLRYIYYYDQPADRTLSRDFPHASLYELANKAAGLLHLSMNDVLPPEKMAAIHLPKTPLIGYKIQMASGGHTSFLNMYLTHDGQDDEPEVSEAEVTAAVHFLAHPSKTIGFLQGNFERDIFQTGDKGYADMATDRGFRKSLVNQGFHVKVIDAIDCLPDSLALLVIASPAIPYSGIAASHLSSYIARGGNLLLIADSSNYHRLLPFLQTSGVKLTGTRVENNEVAAQTAELKRWDFDRPFGFAELSGTGINLKITDGIVFNKQGPGVFFLSRTSPKSPAFYGFRLMRKIAGKEQRIAVIGSPSVFDNEHYNYNNHNYTLNGNIDLGLTLFRWLSNGNLPLDGALSATSDHRILYDLGFIRALKTILLFGITGGFLLAGGLLLLMRFRS